MRITVSIFVLIFLWSSACFGQQSTISIVSESSPFVLHINSTKVNPTANTVAIGSINVGKNHVRLSFTKKGMPELTAQIDCPNDGFYHQLSYRVVTAAKGPNSLSLISDYKAGEVVTQTKPSNAGTVNGNSNQKGASKEASVNKNGTSEGQAPNSNTSVAMNTQVTEGNINSSITIDGTTSNNSPGQSGQVSISLNTSGMGMSETASSVNQSSSDASSQKKVPQVKDGLVCNGPTVTNQPFIQVKYKISQIYSDRNKAKEVKDFINNNCMLSAQVAELVKMIQYSDDQLDVAQFGFMHTFDQAKYDVVVNALIADYNKEKLLNFIGSYGSDAQVTTSTTQTIIYTETKPEPPPTQYPVYQANNSTSSTATRSSPTPGCSPMDIDDFQEALDAADEPIGENEKMQVAKSVFDDACLSTNQVLRVVDLFIDEDRKLDFAKFAFSRTSDKDKYFRINKAFINDQRIAELSNFVKQNK